MSKFLDITASFLAGRDKVKDFAQLRAHVEKTLPGFSMSVSWPAEKDSPLGYMNGFVNPPAGHSSFKPVFVIAKDEADFVRRMLGGVPRLLKELSDSESELEIAGDYEWHSPDRKALARKAREEAKANANGGAPGPAVPVSTRGPRKAIREGRVVNVHR